MPSSNLKQCRGGYAVLAVLLAFLCACMSPTRHITNLAREADVTIELVPGARYQHLLFRNPAARQSEQTQRLLIYIEGDGLPWIRSGSQPARDPTPRHPLALNLFLKTEQAAWYVTRPCYNDLRVHCIENDWTYGRYSEQVVTSLTKAIRMQLDTQPYRQLVLIGYSGGGALATLIAARLSHVVGVVSIAGNLDTRAWTDLHEYEPLASSLNPIDLALLNMPQIILSGDRDTNVPLATLAHYLERQPYAIVQRYAAYDHVCCWEKDWPTLLRAALAQIDQLTKR